MTAVEVTIAAPAADTYESLWVPEIRSWLVRGCRMNRILWADAPLRSLLGTPTGPRLAFVSQRSGPIDTESAPQPPDAPRTRADERQPCELGGSRVPVPGRPTHEARLPQRTIPPVSKRLGLRRIRFHNLRHTHATIALRAGVPVKVVTERLGHASATMTLAVYAHVMPGMQADAANQIATLVLNHPSLAAGSFDTRLTPGHPIRLARTAALSHSAQWRPKSTYIKGKLETQLEVRLDLQL